MKTSFVHKFCVVLSALLIMLLAGCAGKGRAVADAGEVSAALRALRPMHSNIASHQNKRVYVVELWETACQPCRKSLLRADRLSRENHDPRLAIVAVNVGQDQKTAKRYAAELKLSLDLYLDPESYFVNKVGVRALPAVVVVTDKGEVIHRASQLDEEVMRAALQALHTMDGLSYSRR